MVDVRTDPDAPRIVRAHCSEDFLVVVLSNGRTISVPLDWYPRLRAGSATERSYARLVRDGEGIHWPDLGEELSAATLLTGRRSSETSQSLVRWMVLRDEARAP